jgi:hypothetical protein
MLKKTIPLAGLLLLLAACGESTSNQTPAQLAAAACEAEAIVRIGEKTHQLDVAALAATAKQVDGDWQMSAPIVIDPGLRDEAKQTLECRVRLAEGKPAEIILLNFVF